MKRLILVLAILLLLSAFISAHHGRTAHDVKEPGWEYGLKIQKTSNKISDKTKI